MKTYVLIISETFPKHHILAGENTDFKAKIAALKKIHTIRGNYELWRKRVEEINKGEAILSLRVWTGRPYFSKQKEVSTYSKLGIEPIEISPDLECCLVGTVQKSKCFYWETVSKSLRSFPLSFDQIAINDGLSQMLFKSWFSKTKDTDKKDMCIIHFTDFRYLD